MLLQVCADGVLYSCFNGVQWCGDLLVFVLSQMLMP